MKKNYQIKKLNKILAMAFSFLLFISFSTNAFATNIDGNVIENEIEETTEETNVEEIITNTPTPTILEENVVETNDLEPNMVSFPNYIGRTIDDVKNEFLNVGCIVHYEYEENALYENDIVFYQSIEENEQVDLNNYSLEIVFKITKNDANNSEDITLNDTNNEIDENLVETSEFLMPNIVGKNFTEVETLFQDVPFEVIYTYEFSEIVSSDVVISQSIEENTLCDETTSLVVVVSNGSEENVEDVIQNIDSKCIDHSNGNKTCGHANNSFGSSGGGTPIVIDGDFSDWTDKPYSWEYNWNNPYYQQWVWDPVLNQNTTVYWYDENGYPYNLEIRHRMQLYSDGEYVFLHIDISDQYQAGFNGNDYQFFIDGQMAAFQVELYGDGGQLGYTGNYEPGYYQMEVRHRNYWMSYSVVEGSEAALIIKENMRAELELKIPISQMKYQNPKINTTNIGIIEFFTPNLMYRRICCAGTSTGAIIFVILSIGIFGTMLYAAKRKKEKTKSNT